MRERHKDSRRRLPESSRAWTYALTNQLAFPGLGTVLARRQVGYLQAAIMVAGFCLVMGYMFWFLATLFGSLLRSGPEQVDWVRLLKRHGGVGLSGLALCGVAWFWALFSSITIVRQAQAQRSHSADDPPQPTSPAPPRQQQDNPSSHSET